MLPFPSTQQPRLRQGVNQSTPTRSISAFFTCIRPDTALLLTIIVSLSS
ncbi:hypothetical protein COLO4_07599 [Corchorus olitorius]|uniref:Uncharacterized protein n=1 Tax=Corchorus olitorius TaxID=93759 RepID=A0A1R3KJ66_9ROSI|nr:hypothetical protein COLO4_07599 [Corchorus olitorius]